MDHQLQTALEKIHLELRDLAKNLEQFDGLLVHAMGKSSEAIKTLQMIDLLRQQALGLADFTSSIQHMQAGGSPIDLETAYAVLTLDAQQNRLRGVIAKAGSLSPELW